MNEIYKNNKVDINLNKLKNYSLDGAKYRTTSKWCMLLFN